MKKPPNLDYLYNKPKVIVWRIVAGPELDYCQMHDLVFDEYDYNMRQLSFKQVTKGNHV